MSRINAGVIGLGFIGPQHMDAICRTPDARLYAVCDADEAAARAAAEAAGAVGTAAPVRRDPQTAGRAAAYRPHRADAARPDAERRCRRNSSVR